MATNYDLTEKAEDVLIDIPGVYVAVGVTVPFTDYNSTCSFFKLTVAMSEDGVAVSEKLDAVSEEPVAMPEEPKAVKPFETKTSWTDLTLELDDGCLYVGKLFLMMVSQVFRTMFESDFKEKDTSLIRLKGKYCKDMLEFLLCLHPEWENPVTTVIHGYDNEEPTIVLKDYDGHYCLIARMSIDVEIEYITFDENTNQTTLRKENLSVPDHADVRGNCSYSRTELTFSWEDGRYQLLMVFDSQVINDSWVWSLTELGLTMDDNMGITTQSSSVSKRVELGKGDVRMFETPYNNSYECQSKKKIRLKSPNSYTTVIFSHMRLQPFSAMDKFKGGSTCIEDKDTGTISGPKEEVFVPLIVAICLAVVVLLVILGYLIRKKFEGFGYVNMD